MGSCGWLLHRLRELLRLDVRSSINCTNRIERRSANVRCISHGSSHSGETISLIFINALLTLYSPGILTSHLSDLQSCVLRLLSFSTTSFRNYRMLVNCFMIKLSQILC